MKRFSFRLDSVLHLRSQNERKAKEDHAKALKEVQLLQSAMALLEQNLEVERQRYHRSLNQPQSVSNLQNLRAGCAYYESKLQETSKLLIRAEEQLERHQTVLKNARRECQVMENYRDKMAGVHARAMDHADQLFMDELSLRSANSISS